MCLNAVYGDRIHRQLHAFSPSVLRAGISNDVNAIYIYRIRILNIYKVLNNNIKPKISPISL